MVGIPGSRFHKGRCPKASFGGGADQNEEGLLIFISSENSLK